MVAVGRLSREKHPGLAVATSRELVRRGVDDHLDVLGDGPMRARLERRSSGLPITFHGHVDTEVLSRMLADADVALVCCPREAFGLAALEALASGTATVTPPTGAVPELLGVAGEGARSTAAGSSAAPNASGFAQAVALLLSIDAPVRRAAATARAEQASWTGTVESLLRLHARRLQRPAAVS